MPRTAASSHPFDALLDDAAIMLATRLSALLPRVAQASAKAPRAPGGLSANERRRKTMLGRKLDMSCRVAGCKNRSGGPRWGFMCEKHQTLPKKAQQAARDAWKAKRRR